MKICNDKMRLSVLNLAVQGALTVMFAMPVVAYAADAALEDEVAAIRHPSNFVEIGVKHTSDDSAKFGEYNGLNKSGPDLVGNFSVRGGDAYEGGDGTMRWGVNGTDIGTTSRELGATVGNQGQWNLGISYDELRHNTAPGYQTPYQGSMGGNSFVLPADFNGTNAANTRTLSAAQQADFHTVDIGSTRKNTSLSAGYNINKQWSVKFDYNQLKQSGAKLMAFAADIYSGVGGATREVVSILPSPTSYKTDTVNLALNWVGEQAHMTTSYYGSFFRDDYDRVTWQTYQGANTIQTMTTPPGNDFHQLNLSGGYDLSAKTKLTGGLSYGHNTQNDAFVDSAQMFAGLGTLPATSLNGVVVTTHADLKLTDQTIKDLFLSAGIKYDERNNRTASNLYSFNSFSGNHAIYPNTPLSIKKTQLELAGDYRLDKTQHILMAYNHDDISRWCDQYAASSGVVAGALGYYPAGTNCVVATGSKEDKLSAGYKLKASDAVNLNAGYSYAKLSSDFDTNAIAAMIGTNGNVTGSTIKGINAGDFLGFHPYFDENRERQIIKAGVNWQANEKLSVGVNGKYTDDVYDSDYGWKKGNQWSLNLDAAYNYSETGSVSAYVSQQSRHRDRTDKRNGATATAASATAIDIPPNSSDSGTLKDDDLTIGLAFKQAGLMHGKLELVGDLTYSQGKSAYSTVVNWPGLTTGGLTCAASILMSCGDLPVIKNTMTQLKLTGTYQVDKSSNVVVGYLYRRLSSDDYYYNGLQYGFTPTTLMATNQQAGSYSDNVISASYIYSFK